MAYSFLVTWREGLEAGLIIAIVLAYLTRIGEASRRRAVWLGALAALALSVALGGALEATATTLSGRALEAFEGSAMLLAVGILTWMLFWMRQQAAHVGAHLRRQVDLALQRGSTLALAALAFTAVGREGLETALFLFAGSGREDALAYWLGALAGLAFAAALAAVFYAGSARLPLAAFFNVTGVVLIVLAAGLLVNGLKELYEVGAVPDLGPHVWDTYELLPDNSQLGRVASTLLGYDSSPYLGLVIAYLAYLVPALAFFVLGRDRTAAARRSAADRAAVREATS
ncbi:MAG TPA: FTR1 family protein [Dehalococcoidia bacterium]|nr:FTR1 family protein [Dehalococcoidia bacterium]